MALNAAQRGVLRGMVAAAIVMFVVLVGAIVWQPPFMMPLAPLAERLAATLRWDCLVLVCLVASIGNLARHRFFTPADIDGGGLTAGTEKAKVLQAVLQNTLEQSVIALLAHLLWTVTMPVGWQPAVPAAAVLFVVGRLCFVAGYAGGAPARAFGFALTFYPTVALTLVSLGALVVRGIAG